MKSNPEVVEALLPEAEVLLLRFLAGDFPLFAFERWLQEPETSSLLPSDWLAELQACCTKALGTVPKHAQLAAVLRPRFAPGRFVSWDLQRLLSWILEDESRATYAVALLYRYYEAGLRFLWPVALAYEEGQTADGAFDWVPLENAIPLLHPAASLLSQGLERGEIHLQSETAFVLSEYYQELLETPGDWRQAGLRIQDWLEELTQLLPHE